MIPRKIHYCWFGDNAIPEKDRKCIDSWKKFCTDFEIQLWNEDNFNFDCAYVKEAYKAKKWAFVSDYARFWILYNYGGLYFDTDVEIIKSLNEIIDCGPFMGTEPSGGIAPGLGIGAERGMSIFKEILDFYSTQHFVRPDGSVNDQTIVKYTTDIFKQRGWSGNNSLQKINGVWIYPPEVFCPLNYETGKMIITEKTVSIHHYEASWHTWWEDMIIKIERCERRNGIEFSIRRFISFPFRVANKVEKMGVRNTLCFVKNRITGNDVCRGAAK